MGEVEGVILAGGKGERFWPLSRRGRPKQLLRLFGDRTLIRHTWDRLRFGLEPSAIRVVCGSDIAPRVQEELPELLPECLIREPVGRNTAPAAAVAAAIALGRGEDPVQVVTPADHWIPSTTDFWETLRRAVEVAARTGRLVTLGVRPSSPETGYGYIERGKALGPSAWEVVRFREKPDRDTALRYVASGRFFWNSGIFVWRASAFLAEVERSMPELAKAVEPVRSGGGGENAVLEAFEHSPSESIDYGIMEHAEKAAVVEAGFQWSDVGSWHTWGLLAAQEGGNAVRGEVVALDCSDCVLYADSGVIAALGLQDLVVVHEKDITLVLDRGRSQEVRRLLRVLEKMDSKGSLL